MKVLFPTILLLTTLLQTCQQKPTETTVPPVNPASTTAPAATLAPTIAQQFSPILSGSWVSIEYLDAVARTHSPMAAFEHTPAPTSLSISSFTILKDSVEIGASYGLHEGGNLTLLLQPISHSNGLPIKPDYSDQADSFREISYHISAGDTTVLISSRKRSTRRLIYQLAYRRTGGATTTTDLETAVNRGVNKLLLARYYRGSDSLGHPVQAEFLLDGTVRGLPFRKYVVQTDFTGPNRGDELIFDVYSKQRQSLAASFGRDTLKLYTTHSMVGIPPGGTDTTEYFIRGRLRYQLVRVAQP
jgi:hypothetical protein